MVGGNTTDLTSLLFNVSYVFMYKTRRTGAVQVSPVASAPYRQKAAVGALDLIQRHGMVPAGEIEDEGEREKEREEGEREMEVRRQMLL